MITPTLGDQLVARMWRWSPEQLRKDAELDHADQMRNGVSNPDFSISVFAAPPWREGASLDGTKADLLAHIRQFRNVRWVVFTTRSRLEAAGFAMRLSEPPEQHYDVVLGNELDDSDVVLLSEVFDQEERERLS